MFQNMIKAPKAFEDALVQMAEREAAELAELRQRADRAERIVREMWSTFYGQNLQLANWHRNGELEPIDNFFESNDWGLEPTNR